MIDYSKNSFGFMLVYCF